MTVCVDTNVLVQARAASHPFGVILDGFLYAIMNWAVSNRVLTEYQEVVTELGLTRILNSDDLALTVV
jgi:hypothetical protein